MLYNYQCFEVRPNYLQRPIASLMSTLSESGIYMKWEEFGEKYIILSFTKNATNILNAEKSLNQHSDFQSFLTTLDFFSYTPEPEALTFMLLKQIFYLHLILVGMCILLFCCKMSVFIIVVIRVFVRSYH